jgi:hypothetical protein
LVKTLACLVLLLLVTATPVRGETTTATEYANNCTGTDGASPCVDNRIEIADLAQLRRLSERSQDWVTNTTIVLTADINASDTATWNVGDHDSDVNTVEVPRGFSPIGIASTADFAATFDGDHHVISNLFIDRPGSDNIGLFGSTDGAVIKDLTLSTVDITGRSRVGGLVGDATSSQISNTSASGSVTGDSVYVGGLVGKIGSGTITASYTAGTLTGPTHVGGLVGFLSDDGAIDDSYATGAITGSGGNVGGLVGFAFNDSAIDSSYSTGVVVGSGANSGGLVGYARQSATVTDSYWSTDDTTQSKGIGNAGNGGSLDYDGLDPQGLTSAQMLQQSSFTGFDFVGNPPGDPVSNTPWLIIDGSTQPYLYWQDDDGDGIAAYLDAFPLNAAASVDTDGDGLLDDWNTDCDQACQNASGLTLDDDDDNDGVVDADDAFPLNAAASVDTDGDGLLDDWNTDCDQACQNASGLTLDDDDDNDGVVDADDAFPLNAAASVDTDGDGLPDDWNTDCGQACQAASGLTLDDDDDNDGVVDADDAFPLNAAASVDTDGDGLPDDWNTDCDQACQAASDLTLDADDDNDGLSDSAETAQGSNTLLIDTDGDFTLVWDTAEQARNWSAVALSADSAKRYGAVRSGAVYRTTSPDSWEALTGPPSSRVWDALATSSDGSVVVATEYTYTPPGGPPQVWLSEDSGENWSGLPKTGVLSVDWMSDVALSADGNVIALAGDGFATSGDLFVSTDRGVSWSVFDSNKRWSAITMSSDGVRMAAVDRAGGATGQDLGRVWTSADTGATWVEQLASPALSDWSDIAMSADGGTLVAVEGDGGDGGDGGIFISTDFGVTWSESPSLEFSVNPTMLPTEKDGASVTVSADGQRMVAGVQNGAIYLSTDAGTTWNPINSVGIDDWSSVSLSANGLTLLAAKRNGQLYVWEGAGDAQDDFPLNSAASVDTDGDGAPDTWNAGCDEACQDASGLPLDAFPLNAAASVDTDGDGLPDDWNTDCDQACQNASGLTLDDDDDNDGVVDADDAFPLNAAASVDTDGDGLLDDWNTDCDQACQNASGLTLDDDDDNDGVVDADDAFPLISVDGLTDTDGDGRPNDCDTACQATGMSADTDDDNDGVVDTDDAFPLNAAASVDTDGDGLLDDWNTDCDQACQNASGLTLDDDDDNDGVVDAEDLDNDNDGYSDVDELTNNQSDPKDADSTPPDADVDFVSDLNDAFPLDVAASMDTDVDGLPDDWNTGCDVTCQNASDLTLDNDDDGDGVNDAADALPLNAAESVDTDGDGIGNNEDADDDGDGVEDFVDIAPLDKTLTEIIPFQHTVQQGSQTVTIDFEPYSARGPNFEVLTQQDDGTLVTVNPIAVKTFIGTVREHPGAIAAGLVRDGRVFSRISFEDGMEWYSVGGEARIKGELNEVIWPSLPTLAGGAGGQVYAAEVGVDVDSYYIEEFGGRNASLEMVEYSIVVTNAIYIRDVGVEHRLGRLVLRESTAANPYDFELDPDRSINVFNEVMNQWSEVLPDGTEDVVLFADSIGNGGLGHIRRVGSPAGITTNTSDPFLEGDVSNIWRHEVGHNWGSAHFEGGTQTAGEGRGPEWKTIMSGNQLARFSVSEAAVILGYRDEIVGSLDSIGAFPLPIPPRASMDRYIYIEGQRFDVLENDHDSNGQQIVLSDFQSVSQLGGSVERSIGLGPDGRDELLYRAPDGLDDWDYDRFTYRIEDSEGQQALGNVIVWNRGAAAGLTDTDEDGQVDACPLLVTAFSYRGGWGGTYTRVDANGEPSGLSPIEGEYIRFPEENGFHRGELTHVADDIYLWTNASGVQWKMTLDTEKFLLIDEVGSPYESTSSLVYYDLSDCGGMIEDADDDNDGYSDVDELTNNQSDPKDAGSTPPDADVDFVSDLNDAFPLDVAASMDTDVDGLPDDWNTGCDVTCQNASDLTLDNDDDGDSVNDTNDAFPLNAAASVDTDGDGLPDDWNTDCDQACQGASGLTLDDDDDNDGVADGGDTDPLDPKVCRDLDIDLADDCSVGTDGFGPLDDFNPSNDGLDTDGDGLADVGDPDDDNDLVDDGLDACPSTPGQESVDAQGCSETQKDDDGDGVNNATDSCPDTASAEIGLVSTGGCGPSERDTDGDGTNDNLDAFPNDPNETLDSDGDGYGDNEETEAGTDPNDADDQPIQSGLPIWLLYEASKP